MYPLVAGTLSRSLDQIWDVLGELPDSPRRREQACRARAFDRLLDTWSRCPPTDTQQEALLDCVMALHAEVVRSSGVYLAIEPAPVSETALVFPSRPIEERSAG